MPQLALDCQPTYAITVGQRGQGQARIDAPITRAAWERTIDNVSAASTRFAITDENCCAQLKTIEPWADTMTVLRNGRIVWFGWVRQVEYHRDWVEVRGLDALVWLKKLILHADYSATVDQCYHFQNFWNLALSLSPQISGLIEIITQETGVVDKRSSKFNQIRLGWSAVQEMFDSALDVTAFGNRIYAGLLSFPGVINLSLADCEGDPSILKDGDQFQNAAWSDASGSIVGHYPNDPSYAGDGIYPLVEGITRDGMVKNQASANASAKANVLLSGDPPRVPRVFQVGQDVGLKPTAPVDINQLIPGLIANINSDGLCYNVTDSYKLSKVSVSVEAGNENVSVGFEPRGATARQETDNDVPFGVGDL